MRQAFAEFLAVPTGMIGLSLLLAVGTFLLDRRHMGLIEPLRHFLRTNIFTNPAATSELLGTIAAGLITVTSITISLLLIALQQSATSMTAEVFDQFLRRRANQFYFGAFLGSALFALVTLATVNEPFNPVFGGAVALLMTLAALYLLLLLLYTTVDQMRPSEIVGHIQHHILAARVKQRSLLQATRRHPTVLDGETVDVHSTTRGYVTSIDLDGLASLLRKQPFISEVVLVPSVGSFVATGDVIARLSMKKATPDTAVEGRIRQVIRLERERNLLSDPARGLEQLEAIAWTSISTSKSNPAPGRVVIRALREVMAQWATPPPDRKDKMDTLPVVYRDNVPAQLIAALESLGVVSTQSMQHQNCTEVITTFAVMFARLGEEDRRRSESAILRLLSGLGDHVLTTPLEEALAELVVSLEATGYGDTAQRIREAVRDLSRSIGHLGSHSTRA